MPAWQRALLNWLALTVSVFGGRPAWRRAGRGPVPVLALAGSRMRAAGLGVSSAKQVAELLPWRGTGWWEQPCEKLCKDLEQSSHKWSCGQDVVFCTGPELQCRSASHFPLKVINLMNSAVALTLLWKWQSKTQRNTILSSVVSILVMQRTSEGGPQSAFQKYS